ncbi:MAG TPA: protein phosphatase 2C domain-containing protein [Candidatus Acidoferrales bacterium]|nr:protein phosphatase 2C domain-containing protein [Candidatus Acidoferrales bacterium]
MYRGLQAAAAAAGVGGVTREYRSAQYDSMDVEFAELSDVGRVRQGNEDYLGCVVPGAPEEVRARGWLFALADGVGGHDLGEVASKAAVESVLAGFREATPGEPHAALLTRLVRDANTCVLDAGHASNPGSFGMATTIVACALRYDRAAVAHVGDSRCYLIRRGQPMLLTRDHTVANEHVRLKILSQEQAAGAGTRHMLSRSLGSELTVGVEVNEHQVFAGDVFVLCSDGLHGSVSGAEMAALTSHGGDLATAAKRLVDIANQRDGSDNISLQIIRVRTVERVGMYRGRPYRLP